MQVGTAGLNVPSVHVNAVAADKVYPVLQLGVAVPPVPAAERAWPLVTVAEQSGRAENTHVPTPLAPQFSEELQYPILGELLLAGLRV